jgi:hypothetical protein
MNTVTSVIFGINTAYLAGKNKINAVKLIEPIAAIFQAILQFLKPEVVGKISGANKLNTFNFRPFAQMPDIHILGCGAAIFRMNMKISYKFHNSSLALVVNPCPPAGRPISNKYQ